MTDKQIIIDKVNVSGCEYLYTDSRYNDKCCSASIGGDSLCKPSEMICVKYVEYLKEQLKRKEQECEELNKDLHQNFEEKDKLHLIIDRLLEASGYDTNTASAEDFEDVYENMRYEKQQLNQLKQTIAEIKEIAETM